MCSDQNGEEHLPTMELTAICSLAPELVTARKVMTRMAAEPALPRKWPAAAGGTRPRAASSNVMGSDSDTAERPREVAS